MVAWRLASVMAAALLLGGSPAWAAPVETPVEAPVGTGPSLTIVNDTGQAVHYLYMERPNGGWPEDLLMEDVLAAGATYLIQTDRPDCMYDFEAVFADGSKVQRLYFDICASPVIRLDALLEEDALDAPGRGRGAPDAAGVTNWDGGRGSSLFRDDPPSPSPPPSSPPPSSAPSVDRGVPICPGDVRCKKKP